MGAGAATRDGAGRGNTIKGAIEDGKSKRPPRLGKAGIDHAALQKHLLRGMGSTSLPSRSARSSLRAVRATGMDGHTKEALQEIAVIGLKQSKAAGNPDGGVHDLVNFLERKSTNQNAPAKEAVKIKKVCLTLHLGG